MKRMNKKVVVSLSERGGRGVRVRFGLVLENSTVFSRALKHTAQDGLTKIKYKHRDEE